MGRLFPRVDMWRTATLHSLCDPAAKLDSGSRNHSCGLGTRAHVSETTRIMPQPPALCRRTPAHCTMGGRVRYSPLRPAWAKCCQDAGVRARPQGPHGRIFFFVSLPQPRL